MAAASLLQTDIYIFAVSGYQWKWLRYPASGKLSARVNQSKRAVYLINANSNHYDVVHSVDNSLDSCITNSLPNPKTTLELVQEELQRQCLWQQQKTSQHQLDVSKMSATSASRMRKLKSK
ncbi:hypothetical protein HOLleu_01032 [Holothuria leucospilota]|uniref:Uncharacterized protein n=1 Tax=Holothuria leucospilota TaxID=206669 RepID=A0A9Q1CNS3_HOLLE|nr:hypothetical protein HOLleu_01032 [Holothuria leucospilota]